MTMLDTAHGQLYYEVIDITPPWVEAPETILFHHGIGTNANIWSGWLPQLTDRYRIARLDVRGCGRSAPPGPGHVWSMDNMLDDVLAVADAAGLERFHMVGESLGGTTVLCTALRYPDRLLSATGVSCTHNGAVIRNLREWDDLIASDGVPAWSKLMMQRRFHPGALSAERYTWFETEQSSHSAQVILGIRDMLVDADISERLGEIELPVLLMAPDGSRFVGPAITSEMHSRLANGRMQVFAHARHGLAFSHARECATALAAFLSEQSEVAAAA